MTKLEERIAAIPSWYHRIELPGGIITPGHLPTEDAKPAYHFPEDMTGQRVLDVGAWDGYWTFEALKRGAKEVIAIDNFSDDLGRGLPREEMAWDSFDLCREALGYSKEQCTHLEFSLYDITETRLGRFDTILFYGTLYHCRHPLLALDTLRSVCDKQIRIESAVTDDFSAYRGGFGHGYGTQAVTEFYPTNEYGGNVTNWWGPTLAMIYQWVTAAGWTCTGAWPLTSLPMAMWQLRGFAVGEVE